MQKLRSLFSVLWGLSVLVSFGWSSSLSGRPLELRGAWIQLELPPAEGAVFSLPGPWDFFWGHSLAAKDLRWPAIEQRVEAGRPWSAYRDLLSGLFLPRVGRALYRIRMVGLEKGSYSLQVPAIGGRGRILLEQSALQGSEDPLRSGPLSKNFVVGGPREVWSLIIEIFSAHSEGGLLTVPLLRRLFASEEVPVH